MLTAIKKMNMESLSNAWRIGLCEDCSTRLNVFKRKKMCNFCQCAFCNLCILRRPDKKLTCKKCQILTARPLDREKLLNLRTRDLVNYLTSRHISTSGCVEKEDLVNTLIRAVNQSTFHTASTHGSPSASSYPNSPRRSSFSESVNSKRKYTQSVEDLSSHDGIRVRASNMTDTESNDLASPSTAPEVDGFVMVEPEEQGATQTSPLVEFPPEPETEQGQEVEVEMATVVEECSEDGASAVVNRPMVLADITRKEDLDALSIKQLKELLARNRANYKGCVEKQELVERVRRLWNDYLESRKDLEKLSLDELCKICMDAPIECVLLECGHMATCTACGKQLCECPICRQFVVRCVRTFKA